MIAAILTGFVVLVVVVVVAVAVAADLLHWRASMVSVPPDRSEPPKC